jgi:hypothetical protein
MAIRHPVLLLIAAAGLAGCVAYPAPVAYAPAPRPVPVHAAPPPAAVYVAPRPRRQWVPRRCNAYGRCWGGYWR